jgi:NDP-sugar pyrophosphorylase family protein
MKVVGLADGLGTRISEETESKPKSMTETGDVPFYSISLSSFQRMA